jgi:hypothetical protein
MTSARLVTDIWTNVHRSRVVSLTGHTKLDIKMATGKTTWKTEGIKLQ